MPFCDAKYPNAFTKRIKLCGHEMSALYSVSMTAQWLNRDFKLFRVVLYSHKQNQLTFVHYISRCVVSISAFGN